MTEEVEFSAKVRISVAMQMLKQDIFQQIIADKDGWIALANGMELKDQLEQWENHFFLLRRIRSSALINRKIIEQMTTLKQRISTDYMMAFKARDNDRKTILGVLKAAIQTEEKNSGATDMSDEDVMKILNKTVKGLNETISLADDQESKTQLAIIEEYMPRRMSREEVVAKIHDLRAASDVPLNIGTIMKAFALDAVDKKMVAEVFAETK